MTSLFRHITPVPPETATGQVAAVYDQVNAEFSSIGPAVMMMSPAPELLAPGWALLRESLLAGSVPRRHKEAVAVSVSQVNRCEYDIAGHMVFLELSGGGDVARALRRGDDPADEDAAAVVRWARSTGAPGSPAPGAPGAPGAPPVPEALAPEYVGTALALHFVNRMVLILLAEHLLPGGMRESDTARPFEGAPIARAVERRRSGDGLLLLKDGEAGPAPAWAGKSTVGPAYAALRDSAAKGGFLLSEDARAAVRDTVGRHLGGYLPADDGWPATSLDALSPGDRAGATLAILAALAPDQVTEDDVARWRGDRYSDHCLLHLLAFGAMIAVERVEAGIGRAPATG
ncbi:carboxymuconolactone decarboxylase family protein [Streptosporangium sp. H16]|uniref:carboxymuconolactone decarboxylase family protein n=1 Tax=Streptosporangium sp. H16 TaxID=3444184 RepID=UPI003F79B096